MFEELLNGFSVTVIQGETEFFEVLDEDAKNTRKILTIGQRYVAPHFGRTRGDAREIAKARTCQAKALRGVRLARHLGHVDGREKMGNMAHRGQHAVVQPGVHFEQPRAAILPGQAHLLERLRRVFRQGAQHHVAIEVEIGIGGARSGALGAGNGMARYEAVYALAQRLARGLRHFDLGAAGVGQHDAGLQMRAHPGQQAAQTAHRRGQQRQIGALRRFDGVDSLVDQSQLTGALQGFGIASHAQHAPDLARPPQGRGKRAADQSDADHGQHRNARRAHRTPMGLPTLQDGAAKFCMLI